MSNKLRVTPSTKSKSRRQFKNFSTYGYKKLKAESDERLISANFNPEKVGNKVREIKFNSFEFGTHKTSIINNRWDYLINKLSESKMSSDEIYNTLMEAESWHRDIISCLDKRIIKYYNGRPQDEKLQELGINFAILWDYAYERDFDYKYIATELQKIVRDVDNRAYYLITHFERNDGLFNSSIEFQDKRDRYYPKFNGQYMKMRHSIKQIELLPDDQFGFADWFKTESEASDFLKKYCTQNLN